MIVIEEFKGKKVGILGLGRSGLSAQRALGAGGADLILWDDSEKVRQARQDAGDIMTPPVSQEWDDLEALLISPGIPLSHPLAKRAQAKGAPLLSDMDLFQSALQKFPQVKIAAITGTNGKSTAAAFLAHILRCAGINTQLGGNIGRPVLDLDLPRALEEEKIYVLEISSFQLDLAKHFAPHVAVHLNLSPDHLEHHGSLENYARAKARLFAHQGENDTAIIGLGDKLDSGEKLTKQLRARANAPHILTVGEGGAFFEKGGVLMDARDPQKPVTLAEIHSQRLVGAHNGRNAAAASAAALSLGADAAAVGRALETFYGLPHRLEDVRRIKQVRFINDSKATNPEAAAEAIASYASVYWIAGGESKNLSFEILEPHLSKIKHAYLLGEAADEIAEFLGDRCPWIKVGSLKEAVEKAFTDSRAAAYAIGSRPSRLSLGWKKEMPIVLLSPACASFDMFQDFEARGEAFREEVRTLSVSSQQESRFFLAAGGTGGHLFPAEALARELTQRRHRCTLLTDKRALLWADAKIWKSLHRIPSAPFAGQSPLRVLWAILLLIAGVAASIRLIRKEKPDAVIGFGGYASLAPLLAARLMRIPASIHEQGAHWGRATRFLAPLAHVISSAFPLRDRAPKKYKDKIFTTGLPQRAAFLFLREQTYAPPKPQEPLQLLVFGGSQAAQILSRALPAMIKILPKHLRQRIQITQQCRKEDIQEARLLFERLGVAAELQTFFEDIPQRMAKSHLIIARAGASTIGEIALVGRPSILIPIRGAAAAEQTANARFLHDNGAAAILHESHSLEEFSSQMALLVARLMETPDELRAMAQAAKAQSFSLGCQDGARRLADLIEELLFFETGVPSAKNRIESASPKNSSFFFARESFS